MTTSETVSERQLTNQEQIQDTQKYPIFESNMDTCLKWKEWMIYFKQKHHLHSLSEQFHTTQRDYMQGINNHSNLRDMIYPHLKTQTSILDYENAILSSLYSLDMEFQKIDSKRIQVLLIFTQIRMI